MFDVRPGPPAVQSTCKKLRCALGSPREKGARAGEPSRSAHDAMCGRFEFAPTNCASRFAETECARLGRSAVRTSCPARADSFVEKVEDPLLMLARSKTRIPSVKISL